MAKQHRYLVEWSAANPRNSKTTRVLSKTKPEAVEKAKGRLGKKVKEQHLHHFHAIKTKPYRSKE